MAINVSTAFKNAMKAPVKTVSATVAVVDGDTYTSADYLAKCELQANGYYFGVATKSVSVTLLGTNYDLVDKKFELTLKVLTDSSNNTWADCILGSFKVTEQTVDLEKEMTTIKAYDAIGIIGNKYYKEGDFTFPITVNALAERLAIDAGMDVGELDLVNGTYQIPEDLYSKINNITHRDILAEISGATASLASVHGLNSELTFINPKQTIDETWTYDNLKKIKIEPKYGKVSSAVIARTPQEDNIAVVDDATTLVPAGKNLAILKDGSFSYSGAGQTWEIADGVIRSTRTNINYQGGSVDISSGLTGQWAGATGNTDHNLTGNGGSYTISASRVGEVTPKAGSTPSISLYVGVFKSDNTKRSVGTINLATSDTGTYTINLADDEHIGSIVFYSQFDTYTDIEVKVQLEKGSSSSAFEPYKPNGIIEVKLANNEILDDNREAMATPILNAVKGFEFYPFQATTEGHGWHEIGDRIAVTDGTNTWEVIVTDIKLTIDGGLKEEIKGVAPDATTTDYALAGGIKKTIYNTEIKVDKQGQEITSVVSRQDQFENETLENFTQVVQNINSITTTIQTTGGGNLIHNSVGYNIDSNRNLVNWTSTGTVSADSSPESVSYGALSGNQINLSASSSITQRIAVDTQGSVYSFSFKAKKGATGTATVHLRNTVDDYSITIPANESVLWQSYSLKNLTPHDNYFDVVVETNANITDFAITDIILNVGDSNTPWVPASDEILSKSVAIDGSGVTVRSNTNDDYVKLDEFGLNGYHGSSNVFKLQQDVTEVAKLKARNQIEMPPIKIVPITSGNRAGWCFVKEEN